MSRARSGPSASNSTHRSAAALRAAEGLTYGASPVFALMALLTGLSGGDPVDLASHASPLDGMIAMYLLMAAFHAAPWLKLIHAGGRSA